MKTLKAGQRLDQVGSYHRQFQIATPFIKDSLISIPASCFLPLNRKHSLGENGLGAKLQK